MAKPVAEIEVQNEHLKTCNCVSSFHEACTELVYEWLIDYTYLNLNAMTSPAVGRRNLRSSDHSLVLGYGDIKPRLLWTYTGTGHSGLKSANVSTFQAELANGTYDDNSASS
jgi:hypothetical protein